MAVCDEKAAPVLPEERPDFFSVGSRDRQGLKVLARKEIEFALVAGRWCLFEFRLILEEKHEPMGFVLVTVLTNDPG